MGTLFNCLELSFKNIKLLIETHEYHYLKEAFNTYHNVLAKLIKEAKDETKLSSVIEHYTEMENLESVYYEVIAHFLNINDISYSEHCSNLLKEFSDAKYGLNLLIDKLK